MNIFLFRYWFLIGVLIVVGLVLSSSKTLFAIGILIFWGMVVCGVGGWFALNLAGLPGALLAGRPGRRSKRRFISGSIVSGLGQSYVYLASVAFIVNWTRGVVRWQPVSGFLLWPIAFLAAILPIHIIYIRAKAEFDQEQLPFGNPQVEGLAMTLVMAIVVFFVFAFAPSVIGVGWSWVPYAK